MINLSNYNRVNQGAAQGNLKVGEAIKDLKEGTKTAMLGAHEKKVEDLTREYQSNLEQYNSTHGKLSMDAEDAKLEISIARRKKAIAITAVAFSVIAIVGIAVATALTGVWLAGLAALPFAVTLVPASYYSHCFRSAVSQLERVIDSPNKLSRPELQLPKYDPKKDLDLKESRMQAVNQFANATLADIAKSGFSIQEIVDYDLLGRATKTAEKNKPHFYAQCVELIKGFGTLAKTHEENEKLIANEVKKQNDEVAKWNKDMESALHSDKEAIRQLEASIALKKATANQTQVHRVDIVTLTANLEIKKVQLNQREAEFRTSYADKKAKVAAFEATVKTKNTADLNGAVEQFENAFTLLKRKAK